MLADIVNSPLVGFFGNVNDALICYIRLGIYFADGALAVSDFPFAVGIVQLEVNDAQMVAVFSSHGYWSTVDFPVDTVYARVFFVEASSVSTWKFCVGVARYDSIHTWQASDLITFIFLAFFILVISDTRVRKHQSDVCTSLAHLRNDVSNGLNRIANDHFSF